MIALGEDLESEDDFTEDKVLFEIEELPAGETTTEEFTIDEAGTYQVICGVPTHFDSRNGRHSRRRVTTAPANTGHQRSGPVAIQHDEPGGR